MEIIFEYNNIPNEILGIMNVSNVFYSKEYNNYITSIGNKVWYICDENYVIAVTIYQKIHIKYAIFPSEPIKLKDIENTNKKDFLDKTSYILKKNGVAWVNTSAAAFFDTYPTNSRRIPFGSHVINLTCSEDELWKNIHSKHRNSIRRAEKGGIYVKKGGAELISDYHILDEATWRRSKRKSYGIDFFKKLSSGMGKNIIFYIAYKDEIPQAGACFFVNQVMSYYMYGASCDSPEPGATNFLHWEAIKNLKKEGVQRYSFVGCRIGEDENSKYHTIQRFKERFGGELIQGYMFKDILIPWKYNLFVNLYKLKHKDKYTDAVDQEIDKWKELNNK